VFDGGSLQIANFPAFVTDGAGGAVFGWYTTSPLECRAQRVLANGTEQFAHNGATASIDATRVRVGPSVSFDPATGHTVLVYTEQTSNQSQDGVSAQRFDAAGNRLWTPTGRTIVPISTDDVGSVASTALGNDVVALWAAAPSAGQSRIRGAVLDAANSGPAAVFDVSSTPATKFRLVSGASVLGFAIFAWRDEGAGNADVLVQDVLPDGTLGGVAAVATRNGTGVNPSCLSALARPAIGRAWITQVAHSPSATATAIVLDPLAANGPVIPGIGEVLVMLPALFAHVANSAGTSDAHPVGIPADIGLVGVSVAVQGVTVDGAVLRLCNALDVVVGL
jgi:hypothetical protein